MNHLTIDFKPGHVQLLQEDLPAGGPRVLVTGASGLLGRAVLKEFRKRGCAVTGTAYRRAGARLLHCDLTDEDAVKQLLSQCKPRVVVHCAAERRPDVVERHPEAADNINVHATAVIAREAACRGSFLLYISSDYVFDGRHPPYGQDDAPNPVNAYGRSKMEGERQMLQHCARSAVLRVPLLFGEVESPSESAVTALWPKVLQGAVAAESCPLDHCQPRFPTHTRDVAAVCWNICRAAALDDSIRGTFHYSGKEQMTKYEMALAMARAFNLPSAHLIPLTEQPAAEAARRPLNPRLDCSRLEVLGLSVEPRPLVSAVSDCLWPFTPDKRWRQTVFH
ncbi:methionine adenosyltransferase 2 subunit beta isoform X2 [Syngnathus typhle]|uniref:methionine adenosyltransferase 2 subunit beta isoform X2 n=1 Tax=Syngnathus typhle TaxID=161592 RepID=UPI002A6A0BE7|nr:methionine adenosyltransferase 2 subunit beta isoform X2 [Syngnathus typhle]